MSNYVNAAEARYSAAEVFGVPALYCDLHLKHGSVPAGLHKYDIRHSDEDWGDPASLEQNVVVNHMAAVLTATPIELGEHGWKEMEWEDLSFTDSPINTLEAFMQQHLGERASEKKPSVLGELQARKEQAAQQPAKPNPATAKEATK